MQFSVIVPVYNVAPYLDACAESVLRQSCGDFELLLIDDGSTDGSGAACDAWMARDARVSAVHQSNGGLSTARNAGLQRAKGTFVLFLDGDDFYPRADMLACLSEKTDGRDVLCFNYARYTDALQKPLITAPRLPLPAGAAQAKRELVRANAYTSSACFKAVRRSVLLENRIFFEKGVLSEDIEWSARLLRCAAAIDYLDEVFYAYRVRPGSISRSVSLKHVQDLCGIVERLAAALPEDSDALAQACGGYAAFQYATLLINMHLCRPAPDAAWQKRIRCLAPLLRWDLCPTVRLIRRVYRVAGFSLTGRLLTLYFRLQNH